jgi:hypothetical protein
MSPSSGYRAEISHVTRTRLLRAFPALLVLVLSVVVALAAASPAGAKATPCGKKVLGDWFDNGRIDRLYPLNCYEEAIDAIPEDLRAYADAEDVITRALQAALHHKLTGGGEDPSPGNGTGSGSGSGDGNGSTAQGAPGVNTSSPSSVPIPLLVLGGMSIVLLAAGGLGYLSRRRQGAQADDGDDDAHPLD